MPSAMEERRYSRRKLVKGFIGDMTNMFLGATGANRQRNRPRPPGAIVEMAFLSTCIRCGACSSVCTRQCIEFSGSQGVDVSTPYITYENQSCDFCLECIKNCSTGALTLEHNDYHKIGTAHFLTDYCLSWNGAICNNCLYACRNNAISLDEQRLPVVQETNCKGCGNCIKNCILDVKGITILPYNN